MAFSWNLMVIYLSSPLPLWFWFFVVLVFLLDEQCTMGLRILHLFSYRLDSNRRYLPFIVWLFLFSKSLFLFESLFFISTVFLLGFNLQLFLSLAQLLIYNLETDVGPCILWSKLTTTSPKAKAMRKKNPERVWSCQPAWTTAASISLFPVSRGSLSLDRFSKLQTRRDLTDNRL